MTIEKNTVDFCSYVYTSPRNWEYRWEISSDPDFPETVRIRYQELVYQNDGTRPEYKNIGGDLDFDKETWEKIKHAVDGVLEKSI